MARIPHRPILVCAAASLVVGSSWPGQSRASEGAASISPGVAAFKVAAEAAGPARSCTDPATTGSVFVPRFGAWVGAMGTDPERNSFGFTDGGGLRNGDADE